MFLEQAPGLVLFVHAMVYLPSVSAVEKKGLWHWHQGPML